jgi:hypothetical protein
MKFDAVNWGTVPDWLNLVIIGILTFFTFRLVKKQVDIELTKQTNFLIDLFSELIMELDSNSNVYNYFKYIRNEKEFIRVNKKGSKYNEFYINLIKFRYFGRDLYEKFLDFRETIKTASDIVENMTADEISECGNDDNGDMILPDHIEKKILSELESSKIFSNNIAICKGNNFIDFHRTIENIFKDHFTI